MISAPNKEDCHELRVIAINGRMFRVDLNGVLRICASRLLLVSLVLFSAVVALFNPPMFGLELPLYGTFLYWLVICYVVTALWILIFCLFYWLRRHGGIEVPVPAPLIVGGAITGTIWLNYTVTGALFDLDPTTAWQVWLQVLRYFLVAMVIDLISVLLLLPRFQHVVFETPLPHPVATVWTGPAQAQAADPVAALVVNGRSIPVGQLLWMKSVEHYVEFRCDSDTITERAPLRDMVTQAEGADGIQPHRSWWVSRRAIDRMTRRGGNPALVLVDGTEVPVSRHRKAEVEGWLGVQ